jgi:hypothetical protein
VKRRWLGAALVAPLLVLAACNGGPADSASPGPVGTGAQANPLACTQAGAHGTFASPPPGTALTLTQIGQAVGYKVSDAELNAPATGTFGGFESCQYSFTTPGLTENENVTLVVGTNPLDSRSAQQEFLDTEGNQVPLSERDCTTNGCSYHFVDFPGLGDAAVKGASAGQEVIAVRSGALYLEIGPGDLKEPQMVALAQAVLTALG